MLSETDALNYMAATALHVAVTQLRMADRVTVVCGDLRSDEQAWPQRLRLAPLTLDVTTDELDAVIQGGEDAWRDALPDRLLTALNPVTAARVIATRNQPQTR